MVALDPRMARTGAEPMVSPKGGIRRRIASWIAGRPPLQRAEFNSNPNDYPAGGADFRQAHGYEGASMARRLSPWRPNRAHINSILSADLPLLRARNRQIIANNGYGANASETFTAYATGAGIKPSSLIADPDRKKAVQQAFMDWTDEADADGLTDFYGQQSLAARAMFDAGECFIRFRPRLSSDALSVPLQLQLIESEQLDSSLTMQAGNGNMIRQGVEFGPIGNRVAYHFWAVHPGDSTVWQRQGERIVVPAENVLHLYKPLRPGQIRGRPWLTVGMIKLYELDQYDDAELVRKKGAAMFMAFLTRGLDGDSDGGLAIPGAVPDVTGSTDFAVEPGLTQILPDGVDIKFNSPADVGPNYEAFQVRNLYALCASMGLPYHAVTGDVSKANYSSLRASLVEVRRRIEQFQHQTLIFQMCRPVWKRWLTTAVLCGAVQLPGFGRTPQVFCRVKWIPPKWDWVDPLKDAQAEKLQVDAGFKARADVIEAGGEDAEDTDQRIAADHEREERLGLAFAVGYTKSPDPPAGSDVVPAGTDADAADNTGGAAPAPDRQAA